MAINSSTRNGTKKENERLKTELAELRDKVRELEETLDAIRSGEVDAIIVAKGDAQQIYTLEGVDHPYQNLVENIQEGALTLSRAGMILYSNTRFAEMVELSPEKLPGTSLLDYICPEYCREIEEALRNILIDASRNRIHIRRGSSSLPVLLSMSPLSPYEDTKISVVITDRSYDEGQLRLQAKMLEAAGDSVIAVDLNLKIIFWNAAATKASGWTPEEAVGQDLIDIIVAEGSKPAAKEIAVRIKGGEIWTGNFNVRHKDGHFFPVYVNAAPLLDFRGKLVAIIIASHDISDQKRAEDELRQKNENLNALNEELIAAHEELRLNIKNLSMAEKMLRESEKRYRTVADFTYDWEFWIDPEGRFKYISPSADRILGRPVSQFDSADELFRKILHPNDLEILLAHLIQEKAGMNPRELEFRIVRPDGEVRWLNHVCLPIHDEDGKFLGTRGSNRDITDRKLIEESLHESEERYRHLVMYAPAAIYEISADGLRFQRVNDAVCHILGYTQEELLEMNPFDILDEQSKIRFQERVRKRLSGEDIDESVAYRILGRDGREIWATLNIRLNHEGEGGTLVVAHDVTERKVAEEKLRKSYDLTSMILESISGSFIALDKDWKFTYINQRAAIPNISPAGMIGKSLWEIFPEIIGTPLETLYREVMATRKPRTFENKSTDIRGRYFELHVYPIGDGGLAIFGQDITERKDAEVALREAHKRTAAILEGVADTFYSLDNQWRFTMVNPAAEKAPFGRPAAEMLGMVIWELYPSLVGTRIHQHYIDAAEKHSLVHYEAQSPLNGRWYEVFMQGQEGRVDVYMRDITERKKVEDALLESEARYKELVENANSIIIKMDNEGKISFFNSYAQNFFGYSADEILGQHVKILVPPTESGTGRSMETMVNAVLTDPDNFAEHVNENVKKNGDSVWISWRNSAIRDSQGNVMGNLAFGQDITERRKAEEALRESEERFRLALRNAPVSVAIQDNDLVFQWAYNQHTIRPDEIKGKKDTDIFAPEDAARLIELKRACLLTGKEVREKIWLTMNGKRLFLDLYLEPLRDNNGQIMGVGIATVNLTEQKDIEDALRLSEKNLFQSQELLEAVTKGTDVIIAVQDTNFRYIFFNQPYKREIKRITGKDLVIGTSMIELFSDNPDEQRKEINEWSKVLNGENVNRKITFGSQSMNRRVYHVLHTPIRDSQGTIIGAGEVAFDVTKQTQIEEALKETKEYLDNLITYANAPIIVWDPQFRITRFNRAFEHLTGRKAKEVLGKSLDLLLPDEYLTNAMDLIRKTMEGQRWESVEIPILHRKGGIRTVLWNSAAIFGSDGQTIVSTIAQGQDITDRKKIESDYKLRAAEYAEMNVALEEEIRQRKLSDMTLKKTLSLLNASLESTADGILVIDMQGRITGYNQNFMDMWNIPRAVLETGENDKVTNYVLPQLRNPEVFLTSIHKLYDHAARESFDMIEFNDGKIFERYSKPQKIGDSVVGRVWSFRDITDRKRAEEKLVASVKEKEVLLREIHHRVKNNLQLISGLLDMTRMRTADESTNSILTDMMLKIQTMAQIHTRLYESKQFGKISLPGQIRDQVTALTNIYSHKRHEISCDINSQEVFLPVDQAIPCALVVNEILSNAYKHAFKGRKHGTIDISVMQEDKKIRIAIKDDGIGIPDNYDISRTSSLGLKLIRTLVQHQLKGSIVINSRNGTEMIVEFPEITAET